MLSFAQAFCTGPGCLSQSADFRYVAGHLQLGIAVLNGTILKPFGGFWHKSLLRMRIRGYIYKDLEVSNDEDSQLIVLPKKYKQLILFLHNLLILQFSRSLSPVSVCL